MPVSRTPADSLRIPQARVLAALMPRYPDDPPSEWPIFTRAALAMRAGYTPLSGSVTRVFNGIHPDSSSGDPHPGILERKLVEVVIVDVMGTMETSYRITLEGIKAMRRHLGDDGKLPPVKNASLCVNNRYATKE